MKPEQFDVVVIGGGPAGSRTAARTSAAGLSTLLLEKRDTIGYPVRCAEAVGPRKDVERYLELDESLISSVVNGFVIVSPGGERFEVDIPSIGFIVDRELFDQKLAGIAQRNGAVIRTGHQATGLKWENGHVLGLKATDLASGSAYEVTASVTVGADGVESLSPRWAGLKRSYRPEEVMSCAQELVEGVDTSKRHIEFHLGSRIAPGGYAWVFPKGEGMANAGLGINPAMAGRTNARLYLERFLENRCPGAGRRRFIAGGSVVARGLPSLSTGGFLAVGEAANQNNPFSGGGIINALEGADMAADAIIGSIGSGGPSARALASYTKNWKKSVGRTNELFYHAARVLYSMEDGEMNAVLERMRGQKGLFDGTGLKAGRFLMILLQSKPSLIFRVLASLAGLKKNRQ